jgi:hypothetical protein
VEDDHVDRPGVEERQRLKLTGTNSSIGLIVLIPYAHLTRSDGLFSLTLVPPCGRRYVGAVHQRRRSVDLAKLRFERRQDQRTSKAQKNSFSNNVRFADLVVMAERVHPIPFRTRP